MAFLSALLGAAASNGLLLLSLGTSEFAPLRCVCREVWHIFRHLLDRAYEERHSLARLFYARMTDSPPASANGGEVLVSELPGEVSAGCGLSETCGSPRRDAEASFAGQCDA